MDRKDFLTHVCGMGLCSCAVASMFAAASGTARASDGAGDSEPPPPPPPQEDWRIPFVEQRYAHLLGLIAARTDAKTLDGILEGLGRHCASTAGFVSRHAGNPEGFFSAIRKQWHADVSYDPAHRTVSLAFAMGDECPCPLVRKGVTPPSACQCSIGWQRHAFETVFGAPVSVELKESLLRGGTRCAFEVRVAAND